MDKIVIDTHVLVSALITRSGISFCLLQLVGSGIFDVGLSVPLVLEYESAAKRLVGPRIVLSEAEVDDVIDYLCSIADHHQVFFLWRPVLEDAGDEMVLELAVGAGCSCIVTHNVRDFSGAERFGVQVLTPRAFLQKIGVWP